MRKQLRRAELEREILETATAEAEFCAKSAETKHTQARAGQ
jgi:hypothetical protein